MAGVYLAVLVATLVALPLWLASVPEPVPLGPERAPPPPATAPAAVTAARPAMLPANGVPPPPAISPRGPDGATPDAEPLVIERRWSRGAESSVEVDPGRVFDQPTATAPGVVLDRSREARERRLHQFGGTPRTEDAVEAGLAWLAAHQDASGTWDRFEFARRCPPDDRCPGKAVRAEGYSFRPGVTGLALLAFLGAGYTDRDGPYREVVARAVDALLASQMPNGGFGSDERMAGYNNALATFALAEYAALTRDPRMVVRLERAVTRLVLSQQELGGWDYLARNDSGRNDTSITAWMVQALHACVAAGVHVPRRVLVKAALHFERAAEPDGRVRYSDAGIGFKIDEKTLGPVYRHGPAMTAAGLTCEQLLGWWSDGPLLRRQRALLSQQFPSATLLQGRDPTQLHNYYYWYYGTVAAFQTGGDSWQRWNAHLRDAILPLQDRRSDAAGRKRHIYGSWPPFGPHWGKWGRQGSRVYSTALCVLTLEIYYRQTPAYLEDHSVLQPADWRAFLEEAKQRERREAIDALRGMRLEIAEPVLVELLRAHDPAEARAAAVALTTLDSPLGRPSLERLEETAPSWEKRVLAEALRRAREIEALPPAQGAVRVFDADLRLATLELSRSYVGMLVDVRRDGEPTACLRVIRRLSGRRVVVAELVGELKGAPPSEGDTVVSR